MISLPKDFLELSQEFIPATEFDDFVASFSKSVATSVRYNPLKSAPRPESGGIEWCGEGYFLPSRPQFTLDPTFHGGAYYVQEASSMFLEAVFEASKQFLPSEGIRALDLCAAPGGKTTHLASLLGVESLVVANEVIKSRAKILAENVMKWGSGNIVVSNNDPEKFGELNSFFDIILVDAPCSGEGMFRKDNKACDEWSVDNVELCALRSRRIFAQSWDALSEGGVAIFSTCTFNTKEDEEMLDWIGENFEVETIEVSQSLVPEGSRVVSRGGFVGYKFLPHRSQGEGLFIAALRKLKGKGRPFSSKKEQSKLLACTKAEEAILTEWVGDDVDFSFVNFGESAFGLNKIFKEDIFILQNRLNLLTFGVEFGRIYGKKLKPAHDLALFYGLNREVCPSVSVPKDIALDYLRKKDIDPSLFEDSINLVCYEDVPLGFINKIGRRCNNLYPKNLRIFNL